MSAQPPPSQLRLRRALPFLLLVCANGSGCGGGKQSYVPSEAVARQALETALTAWKNGQPVGAIEGGPAPIQVLDSDWYKRQKLDGFEIVGDETAADGKRWFSVRLDFPKPRGARTVRYLVTGKSALWIYRQEDYERSHSWEGYK
jgi:limonene-1,2-epoxide hydrolase